MSFLKGIGGFIAALLGIGISIGIIAFGWFLAIAVLIVICIIVVVVVFSVVINQTWQHFFRRKRKVKATAPSV